MDVGDLAIAAVLVVLVFYVLPRVVIPALARRRAARRGGDPRQQVGPVTAVVVAAIAVGFVIAISWDSQLGRPALAALLVASLGVILAMWRLSRRG